MNNSDHRLSHSFSKVVQSNEEFACPLLNQSTKNINTEDRHLLKASVKFIILFICANQAPCSLGLLCPNGAVLVIWIWSGSVTVFDVPISSI